MLKLTRLLRALRRSMARRTSVAEVGSRVVLGHREDGNIRLEDTHTLVDACRARVFGRGGRRAHQAHFQRKRGSTAICRRPALSAAAGGATGRSSGDLERQTDGYARLHAARVSSPAHGMCVWRRAHTCANRQGAVASAGTKGRRTLRLGVGNKDAGARRKGVLERWRQPRMTIGVDTSDSCQLGKATDKTNAA